MLARNDELARMAGLRSVQRMTLPVGRDAAWAAQTYMRWLPRALRSIVCVEVDGCQRALRVLPDGRTLITAIHDFRPRLPWMIYSVTQALFHAWVMSRFRRQLARSGG